MKRIKKNDENKRQFHAVISDVAFRRFMAEHHRREEETAEVLSQGFVLDDLLMKMLPPHPAEGRARKRPAPATIPSAEKLAKGA